MYDMIKIVADDGSGQITINDDDFYPVELFTWTPSMVGEDHPKIRGPGRHYNFKEIEVMSIELEGHIKADTTEDYWTARKALLEVAIPDPEQLAPWHGYLQFKVNGDSETYYQKVHLVHYEIPTEALYPTVTPMRFEWDGLDGYWKKLSNDAYAKI